MSSGMQQFKLTKARRDVVCGIDGESVTADSPPRQIRFQDIKRIRLSYFPAMYMNGSMWGPESGGCAIIPVNGRTLQIYSHRKGVNRSAAYKAFVAESLERTKNYSNVQVYSGFARWLWLLLFGCAITLWGAVLFFVAMTIGSIVFLFQKPGLSTLGFFAAAAFCLIMAGRFALDISRLLRRSRLKRMR